MAIKKGALRDIFLQDPKKHATCLRPIITYCPTLALILSFISSLGYRLLLGYLVMPLRSVYLAKYYASASQRAHFAIFIPNQNCDRSTIKDDYRSHRTSGTVLHAVGEPIMAGYVFEIKRNYECKDSKDLKELIPLGYIDTANLYDPTSSTYSKENIPRSVIERLAASVPPPPRGQNIRAPIDGVCFSGSINWLIKLAHNTSGQHQAVPGMDDGSFASSCRAKPHSRGCR